ncbi:hypothetical protein EBS43_00575 [bacterium]|nr:hypothetical protein [bacterium]
MGIPIGIAVAGANQHDSRLVRKTIDSIPPQRPDPTKKKRQGMCLDKAYDSDPIRLDLIDLDFTLRVRSCGEEKNDIENIPAYRARRWVVKCTHSWMNCFRRILNFSRLPKTY